MDDRVITNNPRRFLAVQLCIEIIATELRADPVDVTWRSSFKEELGGDSFDQIELILAFEQEFAIKIPDEQAERIHTLGDAVNFIVRHAPALERWFPSDDGVSTSRAIRDYD
jgi:acyl carrier protein